MRGPMAMNPESSQIIQSSGFRVCVLARIPE
jgi:hypothetical protein